MPFRALLVIALVLSACTPELLPDAGEGGGTGGGVTGGGSGGGAGGGITTGGGGGSVIAPAPEWIIESGLTAEQLGVLVNVNDPQSVLISARYVAARGIPARNVVQLAFDAGSVLPAATFAPLKEQADGIALDAGLQAWAITWTTPYRVDCMSIGTAFAVGFDAGFCSTPCAATTPLSTYDDEGQPDAGRSAHRPFDSFGVRPTMMLATGADSGTALDLIARGLAADDTDPRGDGYFFRTTDSARSVRWPEFKNITLNQWTPDGGLDLTYVDATDGGAQVLSNTNNVLFYFQGLADVPQLETNTYLPGAVADHLTSYGGQVPNSGQMSILRWLEAGVTASYGTVVEPCNFTSKFPNTTVLLSHYYRGEPILEAYWKSVGMPGEGLFIGEPLASPWRHRSTWDATTQTLTLSTTMFKPNFRYAIQSAPARSGPWTTVQGGLSVTRYQRKTVTVQPATAAFYRLVRE